MADDPARAVTGLLRAWNDGDPRALDELVPLVQAELRRRAAAYLRQERPDHTLQPTALVHEAYLRLVDEKNVRWQDRAHFFAIAARTMRRVLVDHARRKRAEKRGGDVTHVAFDEALDQAEEQRFDVVAVHEALDRLKELDPQQADIVELRFFGGLSIDETAAVLEIAPARVKREWATARAWLFDELS